MISRRVVLGGSAVVAVAGAAGAAHLLEVDDDVLRALGAEPKALPDEGDRALLETAASEQAEIVAGLDLLEDGDDVTAIRAIAAEQLEALGGADVMPTPAERTTAELAELVAQTGERRQSDVVRASSPALVTVLASLSAGHAQLARQLQATA